MLLELTNPSLKEIDEMTIHLKFYKFILIANFEIRSG